MPDTVNLHFSDAGQGTPVVLLHGFPLSHSIWTQQQESLARHYLVIAPDLRGHGQSPAPAGVYEMETLARDVLALLDSLGIAQAVIMGHSLGGYVTLAAWKCAPQRFLAMGLIDSHASADTDEGRQKRLQLVEKVAAQGSLAAAEAMLAEPVPTSSNGQNALACAFLDVVQRASDGTVLVRSIGTLAEQLGARLAEALAGPNFQPTTF